MSLATNTKLTDNTQWGVFLAIAGYAVFSGQDAIVKWLVMHDYAIFQILFVRSLTISIITLFIGGNRSGSMGLATELTYAKRGAKNGSAATDTYYHYDLAGHLMAESDAAGKVTREYF